MMSWPKWLGWALFFVVVAGIVLSAIWAARLVVTTLALRDHLVEAQTLADTPYSLDPAAACILVQDLRSDVTSLRRQAGWLVGLAPVWGWMPRFGGDLRAVPHLMNVGDGLSEAGALACEALEPLLVSDELSLEQMTSLLVEGQIDLELVLAAVDRSQAAWAQVDVAALSPGLAGKAALLDKGLPLLRTGLEAATVAPDLLGLDQPRTYLVLALNEDELRPGGGF